MEQSEHDDRLNVERSETCQCQFSEILTWTETPGEKKCAQVIFIMRCGVKVEIHLDFHAGEVLVGDYMNACGNFDQATQTIVVVEGGHYIETYPSKP